MYVWKSPGPLVLTDVPRYLHWVYLPAVHLPPLSPTHQFYHHQALMTLSVLSVMSLHLVSCIPLKDILAFSFFSSCTPSIFFHMNPKSRTQALAELYNISYHKFWVTVEVIMSFIKTPVFCRKWPFISSLHEMCWRLETPSKLTFLKFHI